MQVVRGKHAQLVESAARHARLHRRARRRASASSPVGRLRRRGGRTEPRKGDSGRPDRSPPPRARPRAAWRSDAESRSRRCKAQAPGGRASSRERVTIPTGFVKSTIQAPSAARSAHAVGDPEHDRNGAQRLRRVRRRPSSPGRCNRRRAAASRRESRASCPPTRIWMSTKSAPSTARSRSSVISSRPSKPWARACARAKPPTTSPPLLVDVVQDELAHVDPLALARQARDELGRVRRAGADDRDLHPFTPVNVTPSTNAFCARKKMMITGAITISVAAIVRFHWTW